MARNASLFFDACARGDLDALRALLAADPDLVRASSPEVHHEGWTALHEAARRGRADVVRLLLAHGADPNAREAGDNTSPLHWAAAAGALDAARALVDAGGDVHGAGDVHELDVIGWAAFYHAPEDDAAGMDASRRELLAFLVERGARHHIFSAMSVGDLDLIRKVAEENPDALARRTSRFEQKQTPLHFAMNRKRYDVLKLLIELGADLEGVDRSGRTALEVAMLCGDRKAMRLLHAAGAKQPAAPSPAGARKDVAGMADSVRKGVPMIYVPDVARALDWYVSIGFKEIARYGEAGRVNFGMVSLGGAELMLNMHGKPGRHDASLWFYTDRVDDLYQALRSRQLQAARRVLSGQPDGQEGIEFEQDIEDMFYGARQFCIRDLNGYQLYFIQSTDG